MISCSGSCISIILLEVIYWHWWILQQYTSAMHLLQNESQMSECAVVHFLVSVFHECTLYVLASNHLHLANKKNIPCSYHRSTVEKSL